MTTKCVAASPACRSAPCIRQCLTLLQTGGTPLQFACQERQLECVNALLQHGASRDPTGAGVGEEEARCGSFLSAVRVVDEHNAKHKLDKVVVDQIVKVFLADA